MLVNVSKVISVFTLVLLGTSILSGCKSTSPQNSPTPITQPDELAKDESADVVDTPTAGKEATTVSTLEDAGTTLILIADTITTLEPYRMVNVHPDSSVASHLWDTLTLLNDDLQVKAHLAESWRLVNDLTWEFKLHQGITFHNGEPLDANAVRFSVERAQSMLGSLETFAQDVDLKKVEIVDDYTLHFTTHKPVVNLPFHLTLLEILPPVYYSKTALDQLAVAPIGSGPYRLGQWVPGERLVLEAISTYWKGTPTLPRLEFQIIPSVEERLATLLDGQTALATDLPPMPLASWDSPSSRLEAIESTQRMFIGIRIEEKTPMEDKRVRQALNYGVSVEQIVGDWLGGYGERYASWVNPPSNDPNLAPWPYDPDRARELLAEAGYQEGLTATLRTPVGIYDQDTAIAQAIARQLGEINVIVTVEPVEWATYVRQLLSGDIPTLFLLRLNSRGDGLEDAKNLSAAFAFNPTGWQNESFEDILRQAAITYDKASRASLLNEAQAIAYDKAPWIWLWRPYDFYGISQSLDWMPRRDGLVYLYKPIPASLESTE